MAALIDMRAPHLRHCGQLIVVEFAYTKNGVAFWDCVCSCGNTVTVNGKCLRSGHTRSCSCKRVVSAQIARSHKKNFKGE
jgi:hypothetical protein